MITNENGCFSVDVYLAGELIGFTAGLIITLLFLVLTVRSMRLPGTPVANVALALSSMIWNVGGLAKALAAVLGTPFPAGTLNWPVAVMFTGMWIWPIPVLAIWHHHSAKRWQQVGARAFQIVAGLAAAGVISLHIAPGWLDVAGLAYSEFVTFIKQLFSGYGLALLGFGTAILIQDRPKLRSIWLAYVMILLGIFGSALALFLHQMLSPAPPFDTAFAALSKKSALLVLFGSFFLFARFRYADLFIRYSFRVLLASCLAMACVAQLQWPVWQRIAAHAASPAAMQLFIASLFAAVLILCFAAADRAIGRFLTRWLFAAPDYSAASRRLGDAVRAAPDEPAVARAAEDEVTALLGLKAAKLLPLAELPATAALTALNRGEAVELATCHPQSRQLPVAEVELLLPVCSGGRTSHAFAIAPGQARRSLVTHEVEFLRAAALQVGQRIDTLRTERERVERASREAVLLQQVAEAELRALRAQINPHFLFNSLNTVADLVVTDPARAELMTLRLAQVFRHVLAHSARPVTSIREEIDFVRTYLFIEEARFGDRLRVEIDVAPEVAAEKVPSLILQPVVENALKHGLAPKLGPGHLRISAAAQQEHVCLRVEDDGVGPGRAVRRHGSGGVGLKNVAARLQTLYQDRAGVRFESRETGGSLVTILIPWDAARIEA